jgi:hypothetical protein
MMDKSIASANYSGTYLSDFRSYFLNRPSVPTLIEFTNSEERENYTKRILQRIDIGVTEYAVLNIHQIGIEIPVRYVYEELLKWDEKSLYWPNRLAKVERVDKQLENIRIFLFGLKKILLSSKKKIPNLNFKPLFKLKAIKIQNTPEPSDTDNARYLLYDCSGGYPIGILLIYVRSLIAEQGEIEQTQLFFTVAFDFFGKKGWFYTHVIYKIWEIIHNRVTGNMLNRIKQLFELKFQTITGQEQP